MSVLQLILTLVVAGVVLWLVNNYIPMDGKIKKILNAVVVIIVLLWLLRVFGVWDSMSNMRIGMVNKTQKEVCLISSSQGVPNENSYACHVES
jgi:hypothetical protein